MGIITCFGDRTGRGTFFMITDNFTNVFGNGFTSPRAFSSVPLRFVALFFKWGLTGT